MSVEQVELGRIGLKRLGVVGKSNQRDRRPADDELDRLIDHFDANPRQLVPMGRIIKFAVASAMRQEEICRVTWSDLNARTKMLTIRDRKARARRRATTSASPVGGLQLRRPGADRGAAGDPQQRGRADIPLQPQVRQARITKKTA